MTTDNPRFLALVAKVDEPMRPEDIWVSPAIGARLNREHRALKVAIMAHEPERVHRNSDEFIGGVYETRCKCCHTLWPCKPWLDIEAEEGE